MTGDDHPKPLSVITAPVPVATYDTTAQHHMITEAQLSTLEDGSKRISLDVFLTALGLAAGFLQNFWSATAAIMEGKVVQGGDALGAIMFIVSVTAAIITFQRFWKAKTAVSALARDIRLRPIGLVAAADANAKKRGKLA